MIPSDLLIRPISESDSLEQLTELLHRAYSRLAAMGLQYLASRQTVDITREKVARGECFVMLVSEKVVGTILLIPPTTVVPYCDWYNRPDVAMGCQFAVEPALQGLGFGSRLLERIEERARTLGASELTVDTAEQAIHLVEFCTLRGYRPVGFEHWNHTNYRSVLLSKRLSADPV
ncbi:GNAT family N-acetyltransferase [Schlesneria paludicola]|uniref:GNAT family N-acetyltransferase n=1 Tax=Schlesneria paludicola TaxID=360056 RepID=UPI00029AE2E0|nr:GNAT family N-acetyltransferase [Schlesneria paludicola]